MLGALVLALVVLASAVARAYASGCPNEVVRAELGSSQLPDCRAYELVSPVAKNGWPVTVASADGSHVLMNSPGSFAGSKQRDVVNFFDSERTPGGWSTLPFVEPEGLVNISSVNLLAASPDLSEGLFEDRPASATYAAESNLYVWRLPHGNPVEVGPAFSRAALETMAVTGSSGFVAPLGVSEDFGHVLFASKGPSAQNPGVNGLWPGDSTVLNSDNGGFGSLYEYAGVGGSEPELVGVRNQRSLTEEARLKGKVHIDETAELISQCGTALGFPREGSFYSASLATSEIYNAISGSDGAMRVFFTAVNATEGPEGKGCTRSGAGEGPHVDELFVRVDASETVAISEPSLLPPVPGRECSGVCLEDQENVLKRSAGVFQGASKDGSRVFFLTSQPLVDGDKDGATDLYEAEIGGGVGHARVTGLVQVSHDSNSGEAAEVQGVARISEDGSHVYFVARGVLTSSANPVGAVAQPGADNFYVYDTGTGEVAFIGDLCSGAETSGVVADAQCSVHLNSEPPENKGLNDLRDWQQVDSRPVDVTPDGRFVVFTSSADLTPGDTSTVPQVFEYDAEAKTLVRVSVGQEGFGDNGNTEMYGASIIFPEYAEKQNPAPQPTSVSDDGSFVVFQSSDALTSHAVVGSPNVYRYRRGQVSLISDGQDRTVGLEGIPSTSLVGMDGSAQDIFFTTADQLVALDGDTQTDVYDARVGGGFPALVAPTVCEGDECQGAVPVAPSFSTVASTSHPAGEGVVPSQLATTKAKSKARVKKKVKARGKKRVKAKAKAKAKPRRARR